MLRWRRPELPDVVAVAGREVAVVLVRRAAQRAVRLRASAVAGHIEISLPARGGEDIGAALLKAHQSWLEAQVARWPRPVPFVPGALFPLDGEPVRIDWQQDLPRTPRLADGGVQVGGPLQLMPGRIQRWLQARALSDFEARTQQLAAQLQRPVARVSVGDTTSRWGSCAGALRPEGARIAYSWRLILAPIWVRQSIAAHEAAHLIHQNHSPAFHALNRQLDPRAGEARRWLARYGAALHWVGRPS
ncbi:SprT family zinc-dependent metalloprotease, partial [Sandarakinorhabdus sp.]|uniref:M48 family metallopeptidase n=1 Tax=Sandarakinorhabdus sp. TaxID=1916663 RepID=UPI003340CB1B